MSQYTPEQLKTLLAAFHAALDRSPYDISVCPECGLPVVCLPDGTPPPCNECIEDKSDD